MESKTFEAKNKADFTIVYTKTDRFDSSAVEEFKVFITLLLDRGSHNILFNMKNIRFIDSTGLGCLVSCPQKT